MSARKTVSLLVLLLIALSLPFFDIPLARANDLTKVTAPVIVNQSLGPGSNLNLTIRVWNVGPVPEDLDAWQVRLKLDPGILRITRLFPGPILHQIADDAGGNANVLDTLQFNATAGTVDANELLVLGNPQPANAGWTGSVGDLLYVQVRVLSLGVSNITIIQDQLNDIDGGSFTYFQCLHYEQRCPNLQQGCFSDSFCDGVFANVSHNVPPAAFFTYSPTTISLGQNVTFDASPSVDRDNNTIVQYSWDFGDETPVVQTANPELNHTFTEQGGPFKVTLNVTDNGQPAKTGTFSVATIFVGGTNHPPIAVIAFSPQNPNAGERVRFDASGSHDPDGNLIPPPLSLRVPFLWIFGDNTTGGGKVIEHTYDRPGTYTVTLVATDNGRLSTSNTTQITVGGSVPVTNEVSWFDANPWAIPSFAGAAVIAGIAAFVFLRRRGRPSETEAEDDFL